MISNTYRTAFFNAFKKYAFSKLVGKIPSQSIKGIGSGSRIQTYKAQPKFTKAPTTYKTNTIGKTGVSFPPGANKGRPKPPK